MANPGPPSRQQLETLWNQRLQKAWDRYASATAEFQKAVAEDGMRLTPSPDGITAVRRGREIESVTRVEYMRVLKIFSDLVVHDKIPEE